VNLDITKVANLIIHMLDNKVSSLTDKKLSLIIFLVDYYHNEKFGTKVFGDEYIKSKRYPEASLLGEIFDIIINDEDLEEDDERLYIIQELLEYIDIEIINKEKFIELQFIQLDEDFDEDIFTKDELKSINKVVLEYKDTTSRNIANDCFKIDIVRQTGKLGYIL
jgi:hypothetical protein